MPIYRFAIHNGYDHDDSEGVELPDDEAARREAALVIHDLRKSQQTPKRDWTIEVTEGERKVATIMLAG
jgi:hypothetical protein